jgi:hypothetical protein
MVKRSKISYPLDRKAATIAAIESQSEVAVKPRHHDPVVAAAVWCVAFFALVPSICAQDPAVPRHIGVPQDWSQRHIVFSRDALARHPDLIYREARILHQAMQRWQAPNSNVFHGVDPLPSAAGSSGPHRDWSVSPLGGHLLADVFPAKFSFDAGAPPDCTNDYVVFGLQTVGVNGAAANLVAFNNLYVNNAGTGFCSLKTKPTVMFAYNITTAIGGKITTSPILSLDGKKIGFVESVPGGPTAIFHVLTWTAGQGKIGASVTPTVAQMISVPLLSAQNDTISSPWIDYGSDIVYVGANDGKVYKITGVFKGVPTLVSGGGWPVTVASGTVLTSPVLDSGQGKLMVGSGNGNLYQINTATATVLTVPVGTGLSKSIVAAPIVDVTNGTTFVVTADNGTSAVLEEVDTNSLTVLATARIGRGASGAGGTAVTLYEPAFDNNYYNNPSTGLIHLCGTSPTDTSPWQYAFGFTGRFVKTVATVAQALPTIPAASTGAGCTEWTEFFNPTLGIDFFFFGLTQDCTSTGVAGGCVAEITGTNTTPTIVNVNGGPSAIVVDNYSSAAQASSIYLSAEKVNIAYKFTQNGLN